MLLKVKALKLSAGRPVAILHEKTAKKLLVYVGERIKLKNKGEIIAVVDTARGFLKENEIAISKEVIEEMQIHEGQNIEVDAASRPQSAWYIFEKLNGKELSYKKILIIIKDIVKNALTESEIAYFISGIYIHGMTDRETTDLTLAMVATGKTMRLKNAVDKHSIGGVAGNRTTPIVISICSAAGLVMPKTSSRAITSAAGTADVVECFSKVDFTIKEIKEIIKKAGACLVWGGSLNLAPADDKIIQVERILGLDPEVQLLASILSKKLAVGAKRILIDIPFGPSAKVDKIKAQALKLKFEKISSLLGLKIKVLLTDGSQPIGNGIGPKLEAKDVFAVLSQNKSRPIDLENKAIFLASNILEMVGKVKKGQGQRIAKEILKSGKAFDQFKKIIEAQRGNLKDLDKKLKPGNFSFTFFADKSGKVKEISNKKMASIAFSAGCPADKGAGIYLYVHNDYKVKKGDKLLTIYSETKEKLNFAKKTYSSIQPILIN